MKQIEDRQAGRFNRDTINLCSKLLATVFNSSKQGIETLGNVQVAARARESKKSCGCIRLKEVAGKTFTQAHVKQLLEKGKTGKTNIFELKVGKPFDTGLKTD